LGPVALESLGLAIIFASLTLGEDHSGTYIFLLELFRLGDSVVITTLAWAKLRVALHLVAEGSVGCMFDSSLLVESIEVNSGEGHVGASIDRELPLGGAITASFGTVDF
jgi:hypothetical protein